MELPAGVVFRLLTVQDVPAVLEIILSHDEDDYDEAKVSLQRDPTGHYVLEKDGVVIGVTGARVVEDTDRTFMLGWTYLDEAYRGQGLGSAMLNAMLDVMREWKVRKVFATTSDYDGGRLYAEAVRMYQEAGFVEELRQPDYYEPGEAQIVLGMRLEEQLEDADIEDSEHGPALMGGDEIDETDDAYFIDWEFAEGRGPSLGNLEKTINKFRKRGGRVVFVSAPSNAPMVLRFFEDGGFKPAGRMRDFYENGIDEVCLRKDLI